MVRFIAQEIDRVIFAEVEVVDETQLVVDIGGLKDQRMIADLEFGFQSRNVRCGVMESIAVRSCCGELIGMVVEQSFAIGRWNVAHKLVACANPFIVGILVRSGDREVIREIGAQRRAQT